MCDSGDGAGHGSKWCVIPPDAKAHPLTWSSPPEALGIFLKELFAAQPEDVLGWVHSAVWVLHEEYMHKVSPDVRLASRGCIRAEMERRRGPSMVLKSPASSRSVSMVSRGSHNSLEEPVEVAQRRRSANSRSTSPISQNAENSHSRAVAHGGRPASCPGMDCAFHTNLARFAARRQVPYDDGGERPSWWSNYRQRCHSEEEQRLSDGRPSWLRPDTCMQQRRCPSVAGGLSMGASSESNLGSHDRPGPPEDMAPTRTLSAVSLRNLLVPDLHPKNVDPQDVSTRNTTADTTGLSRPKTADAIDMDAVSVGEDMDTLPHLRRMPSNVSDTSSWLALEATRRVEISNLADAIKGCAACTRFHMTEGKHPQMPLPTDSKPDFLSITCMTPPSQASLSAPISHIDMHSKQTQLDVSTLTGPRSTFMRHFVKPSTAGTRRAGSWGERSSYPLDLVSLPTNYARITRALAVTGFERLCKTAFFLCCLYEAWSVSCWLAFAPRDGALPGWCKVLRVVPACLFAMDMVFHFFADMLVAEHWDYLRTYFLADLVATASDITLLVWAEAPLLLMATKLLRGFRLWSFHGSAYRAYKYFYLVARPKFAPQLAILQLMLLVLAHVLAVAWGLLLRDEDYAHLPKNGSLAEACRLYLDTFRLACGSLTFGSDMPSFNQGQRVLCVICAAVRLLLLALGGVWVVWQGVIQSIKDAEAMVQQEGLDNYLQHRQIPIKLRFQVYSVIEEAMRVQRLQQQCHGTTAWRTLFGPLSDTLSEELWLSRLTSLGIIREIVDQQPALGIALAHRVHEEALPANVRLYCAGEISFAAFLVLNGVLHVQSDNDAECESPALDFTTGMWVGEQALVNPELLCIETVMSVTRVELMVVPAQEFHECLRKFDMAEAYRDLITQKLWRGLCGRCGAFGQHFSNKCPKLKAPRRAPTEFLRGFFSQKSSVQVAPAPQEIAEGLRNFLIENHIERLLVPMQQCGITNFGDITNHTTEMLDSMIALSQREACILADAAAKKFQDVRSVLTQSGRENHLVFISHYKVEAGTEATLMQTGFETMIQEYLHTIGLEFSRPVFTDTEDLRDLNKLKEHVRKSHNLILLLTKGVLSRPWCLVEIVTAVHAGTRVVPVEIKRAGMDFEYPDEAYYQRMLNREELDESAYNLLLGEGFDIGDIVRCIQQVFKRIALPFSPHRTLNIREAEMWDILKQCRLHREESPNDSDSFRLFPTNASTPRTAQDFSRLNTDDASVAMVPPGLPHEELV